MNPISHEVVFRPRARLVSVLGEHLISDPAVGLIELVKNAYDADATHVVIELLNPKTPTAAVVTVTDNGSGMTLDAITTKWLSPATDHKEQEKLRGNRSALGRLPIGEKGVGRFAVHHLGHRLRLITRATLQSEIVMDIDWDRFDESEAFLDGLSLQAVERTPEVFIGDETGTRLEITKLRSAWSDGLLRKVHRTLRRLQSPLREEARDFRVSLVSPDFPEIENIDPTDILDRAHYEFRAVVQSDGECDYEYLCRHPGVTPRTRSGTVGLLPLAAGDLIKPECGSFWLNLYVWDRSSNFLQASEVARRELDAHSGVSLFRDGLRVLPYGEPGDDWLFLDQERIQAPADRIGNNQVIGLALVDQSTNLQLRDKTNREGLIENQAFQDLRTLTRAAIRLFTTHWRADRPSMDAERKSRRSGDVDTARALASAIGETASEKIPVRLARLPSDPPAATGTPSSHSRTITQRQAVDQLLVELDDVSSNIRDQKLKSEILRQLAATGLAAERVVHEFGRQVAAAIRHLGRLEKMVQTDKVAEDVRTIGVCLRTLRDEFRVLAPYETAGRADRKRPFAVRDAIALALLLNQSSLASSEIRVLIEGENFTVQSRHAAIVQILDNLLHNAVHWVQSEQSQARRIKFVLLAERQQIVVADSGPGVHPEIAGHLFEPFTTLKVDGTGLGLYISAQLAESLGCILRLADADERPPDLDGAAFVLEFTTDALSGKEGGSD